MAACQLAAESSPHRPASAHGDGVPFQGNAKKQQCPLLIACGTACAHGAQEAFSVKPLAGSVGPSGVLACSRAKG